ncbi:hypothetical protein BGX34_007944 [Mortierella sp. NVP85]|nr:hypothetical protein BGX34_007944 [Mortierella sp. NVP85]
MSSDLTVTIVGGGIGGLALANMFEKAGISYIVLEKATHIRALGASLGLDASSLPVMEQLGLLNDFYEASNPVRHFNFYNDSIKPIGMIDFSDLEEIGGYPAIILDRPAFYNILLKNLPKHKIHYNKRVLSVTHNEEGATVGCADGSTYLSDIVVGADGAYSAVRQNIYRNLKQQGMLPASDDKPLGYNQHCLVGVTEPMDPEQYPMLKNDFADFDVIIPKSEPFYAIYMTLPGNRISWAVIQNVAKGNAEKGEGFRFSEWGPEATLEMANFVRHLRNPYNATLGDIIDKSPNISKIMLEEKFYETWYDGRVVLLGDGLGASLAILEAVHLCNLLVDMPKVSQRNITKVFSTYFAQRSSIARAGLSKSRQFGKVMGDRGPVSQLVRKLFLGHMPSKLQRLANIQRIHFRPQLHFLPQIPNRGSVNGCPQERRLVFN